MHWCMDETLALLAMIPFIGYLFRRLHAWYHKKMGHTCHEKHCEDKHVEHKYSPYDRPACGYQKVSEEDMKYLRGTPAPLKITVPVTIEEGEEVGYTYTSRGIVVGAIVVHGPMTHEQIAARLSHYNVDEVYSTINELIEGGELVLDGDLVKEGNVFK